MSDLLSRVTTGTVDRPHSILIHGVAGCGKSTFASKFDDPLFIDTDNRTAHLPVKRIVPTGWDDIIEIFRHVARGELACKTVVVDTIDHAELMLHASICAEQGVTTIEEVSGGYGKGLVHALTYWRKFGSAMDAVRARGVNVVLLAHSADKTHKNVTGEDYGRVEIKLDKRASGFLRERVDAVGYASFDTVIVTSEKTKRTRAKTTGKATLSFAPSAAIDTKRFARYPEKCEFTYEAFTANMGVK